MNFPNSSNSPSSPQYSQYSQYPFNPYPHQDRNTQEPMYTLRDHTNAPTPTAADDMSAKSTCEPSNDDSLAPPQDMFVALERLLLGISPFPPSIPTNLAKPTCPPLHDQNMVDASSSTSSSLSSTSVPASEPSEFLNGQSLSTLEQYSVKRPQRSPLISKPRHDRQYRQSSQHCFDSPLRSLSPTISQYSYGSPSPSLMPETRQELPYWSPSTPGLNVDHDWSSNHSSPVLPSQRIVSSSHGASWSGTPFEQMSMPWTTSTVGGYMAPSDGQGNSQSQQHLQWQHRPSTQAPMGSNTPSIISSTSSPNITRRAARTPSRHRTSWDMFGMQAYESPAHYTRPHSRHHHHHHHHHHRQQHQQQHYYDPNNPASSPTLANNAMTSANLTSSSNAHSNNYADESNSICGSTRGGVKSYPCPTCSKPFPTRTQLKSHMAIHVDNFPFPCLYVGCDLHFKRKHDLRRHVDAKHALVKKYLCSGGCGEGFGRRDQMIMNMAIVMGSMQITNRLDLEDTKTQQLILGVYVVAQSIVLGISYIIQRRIQSKKDTTVLKYLDQPKAFSGEEPKLITTTNMAYDLEQNAQAQKQALIGLGVMLFLNYQFGVIRPLVVQSILPVKNALQSKFAQVYLFNKPAEGDLKRPWKADNPFAALSGGHDEKQSEAAEKAAIKKAEKKAESKAGSGSKSESKKDL
ncbi:hypothetical protein BGZ58_009817 [Dissophora ornata]|nr:hypothetical protein BGZ58_009817 [Dissophora ornata]